MLDSEEKYELKMDVSFCFTVLSLESFKILFSPFVTFGGNDLKLLYAAFLLHHSPQKARAQNEIKLDDIMSF